MPDDALFDAIVIGGGFYGAAVAIYLSTQRKMNRVLLIEREPALLRRASYHNQARIHHGYHYPRSFTTAYRSRINMPRFIRDWPDSLKRDFTQLYGIARRNSRVTARQFERFCREIGARLEPCSSGMRSLFETRLIEEVFRVEEYAFDATCLARQAHEELTAADVEMRFGATVTGIYRTRSKNLVIELITETLEVQHCEARYVFNCTYSRLNQLSGDFTGSEIGLKQELTEMALMEVPAALQGLGITVMDGPFFSMMPFPPRDLHTVSHVRYTPHLHWVDQRGLDPHERLRSYEKCSRADRMVRDIGRYVPAMLDARYMESLFEIKTVLVKNEGDDGRPILFERHAPLPHCYSILGGKIDNIYDVLEMLNSEPL